MKKFFSFLLVVVLIACSKDPVIYTLTATANPAEGGSVSPSSQQYDSGDVATVRATASSEYVFQSWSGSASGSSPSTTVTMDSDKAVVANFVKKKYALTVNTEGEGSVTEKVIKAGVATDYTSGTVVELTAVPEGEWLFVEWTGDLTGSENPKEITIDKAKTVTAVFVKKQYPLTIEIEGEGTVSEKVIKQGLATDYNSGTIVELTAEPTGDWEFVEWTGDITSTENPVQITIDGPKTVKVKFKESINYFQSLAPSYPSINSSTSLVQNNRYHPGYILTRDDLYRNDKFGYSQDCDCEYCGCRVKYELQTVQYRFLDYNNDDKLDFVGWMMNNSDGYGSGTGKYLVVTDVNNEFKREIYDSKITFGGNIKLNDFNGDGRTDVLVLSSNDHGVPGGGYFGERLPLRILYFNDDGSFNISEFGPPTSTHDLTTFDIDQDGDVDIVNFEWWMKDGTPNHPEVPLFYINDGNGNFTVTKDYFKEHEKYESRNLDYIQLSTEAFDLNNDGYLDLILGGDTNSSFEYGFNGVTEFYDHQEDIKVMWGNSDFIYTEENLTRIELEKYNNGYDKLNLGFGIIDYNNDGLYDIVGVGQSAGYSGGFLNLYKNNGDQTFTRVTESQMDMHEWLFADSSNYCCKPIGEYDIPGFYHVSIIDVDQDGDYDIVPVAAGSTDRNSSVGAEIHWRNDGGYFTYQESWIGPYKD